MVKTKCLMNMLCALHINRLGKETVFFNFNVPDRENTSTTLLWLSVAIGCMVYRSVKLGHYRVPGL